MQRAWYLAGWGYVAVATLLVYRSTHALPPAFVTMPSEAVMPFRGSAGSDAAQWFDNVRPHCNSLEVELQLQSSPPPDGWEGTGYGAACWAVAGRVDRARTLLLGLPSNARVSAASIVFNIGHPIADAGDDRSAGPIMQLVVEFQPDNYMAMYHAGMSYYAIGQPDLARRHLLEFMRQYSIEDGWRSNAREVLRRLGEGGAK